MRVFPLSNWTESDVWRYIGQERIELPSLYYAHERDIVRRDGFIFSVTALTPPHEGDAVERLSVRFRTVGDITGTKDARSSSRPRSPRRRRSRRSARSTTWAPRSPCG
jgi:3'-phosphoadenosine 5'-phosphosulfate sulfotransferase (PAPS reductase)/FAD synthetase